MSSPAALSGVAGGRRGTVGLKRVAQRLADAKKLDDVLSDTRLKKSRENSDAANERRRARRHSIDTGPEDWPNNDHVGNEAPPIGSQNLAELVEELADLEIAFPLTNAAAPTGIAGAASAASSVSIVPPGQRAPLPPMQIIKVHLPNATELATFPDALQVHLKDVGMATLRTFLHPMIMLRQRRAYRARLVADRQPPVAPVGADFVSTLSLFRNWPAEAIDRAVKSMKLRCYEPREFVAFEREPASAIIILVSGSVQLLTRKNSRVVKKYSAENLASTTQSLPIVAFGELSLLTDEPWQYAIRTQTKADVWLLTKPDFARIMQGVPSHIVSHSIRTAFQRRNDTMRVNFPIDAEAIRSHPIFKNCSIDFARDLVDRLEPHAVPRDYVLARENEPAGSMFFLRHGHIGVYKTIGGEETKIASLVPNTLLCDVAVAHGSTNEATYRTLIESDLYMLPKSSFAALIRQHPLDLDAMLDAARSQRQAELYSNPSQFRELVRAIPIIRDVLPHYYIKDFVKLLHPRSIRPLSSVCSTATFCDRIMLLTKGKIRLGKDHHMQIGECIGWTCCVPHRWGSNALSLDATVEVLEITCQPLMSFLDERGLLAEVISRSKVVMFPNAFPPEETKRIMATLPKDLFPMYPISRSRTVNLNEMGFCTVHMPLLAEVQREEEERKQRIKDDTPAPFKQLSHGVWIPTNRQIRGFTTSLK